MLFLYLHTLPKFFFMQFTPAKPRIYRLPCLILFWPNFEVNPEVFTEVLYGAQRGVYIPQMTAMLDKVMHNRFRSVLKNQELQIEFQRQYKIKKFTVQPHGWSPAGKYTAKDSEICLLSVTINYYYSLH